jgi:lysine 2,3-aminomutase
LYKKKNVTKLFSINTTIYSLLKEAGNPAIARNFLISYIEETKRFLNRESHRRQSLEFTIQNQCLQTFRKIISTRSKRITKFNIIRLLWNLAHNKIDELPSDLNDGFFEEMIHLFLGLQGRSGIYEQEIYPEFVKMHGRKASILRSEQLDKIAAQSAKAIKRYPTGLDKSIQKIRYKNRKRIQKVFNATEEDWNNYNWHLQHIIRDSTQLSALIQLTTDEKTAIDKAKTEGLPFGITPYYVSLMDEKSIRIRDHAVRAQVIPPLSYVETMIAHRNDPTYNLDFMLEQDTSPIDLITRRYPNIVILKPCNTCGQICVYCQRNWEINDAFDSKAIAGPKKIEKAINWIREHNAITEVLITGGDPLIMNDNSIDKILSKLVEIDHLERIRIGSRTPVVLPQRITDSLIKIISQYHQPGKLEIALVTHFGHPYEVTPETMKAVQQFKLHGISVYNQAVFTYENSRRFEMVALRKILRLIGVDPYYTFNTKGKEETQSYRVPMARLRQEIKEEARLLPGLIRTDEPVYNVPKLGKNYVRALQHHSLLTILPDGRRVYEFHPWEKNLSLADTYIDIDVSISEYLNNIKKRGENPNEYKTIWYYY